MVSVHRAALLACALLSISSSFQSQGLRPESSPRPLVRGGPVWHPHEFAFATGEVGSFGNTLTESSSEPYNPWLNWRFNGRFRGPGGEVFDVPGFYAGSEDGSGVGDVWKVRFAPNKPGLWRLTPQFEYANTPINVEPLDVGGQRLIALPERSFWVEPLDPQAPGFLSRGPLRYVGESYLGFPDGTFWIKGGTNSPENFFGYAGFDGAQDTGGFPLGEDFLHRYEEHEADWMPGDPDWASGGDPHAGRGIIGALNYLSSEGVNAVYFLPNNLGGDGADTFPFTQPFGGSQFNTYWDASRMEQWNTVMEHATRKGILLHLVLAEQEIPNVNWFGGSGLSTPRKLYFKNLLAMFGHNLGIKINFCEENQADPGDQFSVTELAEFADYYSMWDVYGHPLSVHTQADDLELYSQIIDHTEGNWLTSTSLQLHGDYGAQVEAARELFLANGGSRPIIDQDEQGSPLEGLSASNAEQRRKEVLYDVYFSGGNIEWYCGLDGLPVGGDVDLEDFRTREPMWRSMRIARNLLEQFPFWRMSPDDDLLQNEYIRGYGHAEVFAKRGSIYLIYFPIGLETGDLDMTHQSALQSFTGRWFNPRTGLEQGAYYAISGGEVFDMPDPPFPLEEDWVFIVRAD